MFYQQPPAGQPICVPAPGQVLPSPPELFLPWQAVFLDSGTAALAAAVTAAVRLRAVDEPEVILPGYGCPDLVSAVWHAGARPVLVDLEGQRPWLDLEQLAARIGPQTVAIVAAGLFGIRERMASLRAIAGPAGVLLIEDSAQAFPASEVENFWSGDLVVVSFGRGKPVSLLGGGAVLFRDDTFRSLLPDCRPAAAGARQRLSLRLKVLFYNLMSSPRAYWLPAGLPFLHLGETRFQPLAAVRCMDAARLALLGVNVDAFRQRSRHVQSTLSTMLAGLAGGTGALTDLPSACQVPAGHVLLRYPVLLPPGLRDVAYKRLNRMGLGVSTMYPAALPAIAGLEHRLGSVEALPAARDFARRLLTLPVHARVTERNIRAIETTLAEILP